MIQHAYVNDNILPNQLSVNLTIKSIENDEARQ